MLYPPPHVRTFSIMAVIKTTSQRARTALSRLLPNLGSEHYARGRKGTLSGYYIIADEDLPKLASVTGINEIKRPPALLPRLAA